MKIHLLSGFLGSGKTTAIQQAIHVLIQQGIKTGVITNDQGTQLVDGGLFKKLGFPNREVINGCFCCNYNDLDASIVSLSETDATEVIFAESVGSCTDIVATVLKPMLQFRPGTHVTLSTFADARLLQMILNDGAGSFDDAVRYIYLQQLKEASIIVVNKIDLMDEAALLEIKIMMRKKYNSKILLYQNSLNTDSIQQWLQVLDSCHSSPALPSLNIDYDVYATGEAKLAWIDQLLEICSPHNNAIELATDLANAIYTAICKQQYPIGHLKFLLNDETKISFTSSMEAPAPVILQPATSASLLINIRVQTAPENITRLISNAIAAIETISGCSIIVHNHSAFQPGYPRPAHRIG